MSFARGRPAAEMSVDILRVTASRASIGEPLIWDETQRQGDHTLERVSLADWTPVEIERLLG